MALIPLETLLKHSQIQRQAFSVLLKSLPFEAHSFKLQQTKYRHVTQLLTRSYVILDAAWLLTDYYDSVNTE